MAIKVATLGGLTKHASQDFSPGSRAFGLALPHDKVATMQSLVVTPDSPIVARLFEKKRLLEAGDPAHKGIRPLLVVMGGGMRGVSGGGAVVALNEMGLNGVFDLAIGSSAGAPTVAYFLAGTEQSRLGTSIFYEELSGRAFINPWRVGKVADIDWLGETFSKGAKKLDTDAVLKHRTACLVALTNYTDKETVLFNAKDFPDDIVRILQMSSAMPVLYPKRLLLAKNRYIDGTVTFRLREVLKRDARILAHKPTDILVLTNCNEDGVTYRSLSERIAPLVPGHFGQLLRWRERLVDDLAYVAMLPSLGINVGILPSPRTMEKVGNLTTDASLLWQLGDDTQKSVLQSFGRPDVYVPLPRAKV